MLSHKLNPQSLMKTLLLERFRWRALITAVSLVSAVFGVLAPYAQKSFTDSLLGGHAALSWVLAAFALGLAAQVLSQLTLWLSGRESLISQKALSDALYARLLAGPGGLVGKRPAGEAVSLFAVDVPGAAQLLESVLPSAAAVVFPLILAPIALHLMYGIPWYACLIAISFLGLVNFVLAQRQSRFFYNFKLLAAQRTGLVAEWVQNIRTLRILGWVESNEAKIFSVRKRETTNRKGMVTNGQTMNAIATSSTFVLNILAVVLLLKIRGPGSQPSAGELLSLLWILGVFLSRPLRQFPWVLVIGLDSLSSIRRLEAAFAIEIMVPKVVGNVKASSRNSVLEVRAMNLNIEGQQLLSDINIDLGAGELIAIIGEVGSGKSLLLQSLLGGTGATFESFSIRGEPTEGPTDPQVRQNMAFVPQEGFTIGASLSENVHFEYLNPDAFSKAEEKQVLHSLHAAQFVPERERVTDGLRTEIGERGVNLSGGQRQRIGLARAHYSHRPIIVMDDCLSAVDVDTERLLIEKLIEGEWGSLPRLLATHRMSVLPHCDRILFMEHGKVILQGTFNELYESSSVFTEFVRREAVKVVETTTKGVPAGSNTGSVSPSELSVEAAESEVAAAKGKNQESRDG